MSLQQPEVRFVRKGRDQHIQQTCGVLILRLLEDRTSEAKSPFDILWLQKERVAICRFRRLIVLSSRVTISQQSVCIRICPAKFDHLVERRNRTFELTLASADQANASICTAKIWKLCDCVAIIDQRIIHLVLLKKRAAESEIKSRR